jgi:hypothetical protein
VRYGSTEIFETKREHPADDDAGEVHAGERPLPDRLMDLEAEPDAEDWANTFFIIDYGIENGFKYK